MPAIETGRQQFKADRRLTTQSKPYGELNNRDILYELLSWEVIDAASEGGDNEGAEDNKKNLKLLSKFDKYMIEKEEHNLKLQ